MTIPSVQSLLRKHGISPKKGLGQHFLHARPTMEKIVASLDARGNDTVVEIGPGLGIMTGMVAARARHVFAVEKDAAMIDAARSEFGSIENITWLQEDILEIPLCAIIEKLAPPVSGERIKIIGNLPYNISSPILFCMIERREIISRAVVMLQREVADRIVARPGGKNYGILSVLLQSFADCKKLFDVSAKSFVPPPEVVSSVLRLDFKTKATGIQDEGWFRKVVKGAFGRRRKTLRNAMLGARLPGVTAETLDGALARLSIEPSRRPETLSPEEFALLSAALRQTSGQKG